MSETASLTDNLTAKFLRHQPNDHVHPQNFTEGTDQPKNKIIEK